MKLKPKTDGTPNGTWVEDEHGNRIENVRDIRVEASYEMLEVTMTFFVPRQQKRQVDVTTHDQLARGEKEFVDVE